MNLTDKVQAADPGATPEQVEIIAEAIVEAVDPIYSPVDRFLREHAKARAARAAKSPSIVR